VWEGSRRKKENNMQIGHKTVENQNWPTNRAESGGWMLVEDMYQVPNLF